ncbi:Ccn1 G1 cyclin [Scheffersomyces xylosifermentans]|uniref:Ccn1 G1 cyclin n=1 Tax=Scheffersomyces xylosifermentans TaxID=1304137 RepID=UPI00315CB85B
MSHLHQARSHNVLPQSSQTQAASKVKYGPPPHVKSKPYSMMLELLETQANKKLTSEYSHDITKALAHLESLSTVNPAMIDLQPEIQWFMRPFLLDFLIELHSSFKLQPQTLFLCLNIIDRYCAKRIVFKRHYQLVGCTALWIAGKYEDKKSRVPTLKELTIMCRNAYDEEMFIQMEMHILSTLEWCLSHPTLEDCLQLAISHSKISSHATPCKYNKLANSSTSSSSTISAVTVVARFFCELSLYDKYFLSVPTSLISITANLLACSMLQIPNASDYLHELIQKVLVKKKRHTRSKRVNRLNLQRPPRPSLYSNNNESYYSHIANAATMRHTSFDDVDQDFIDCDDSDEEDFAESTEDEEDEEIEEPELENQQPDVHGAFLSGLDENSIMLIKRTALMFIIQLSKVTEVLSKKYESLGVIQVINNFHSRFTFIIQSIYENQDTIISSEVIDIKLIQLSEVLLQFPKVEDDSDDITSLRPPQSPHIFNSSTLNLNFSDVQNAQAPVTPPSASSQYSVFSNKRHNGSSTCVTPIHANMSSASTYNSGSSSILRNGKSRISKGKTNNISSVPSANNSKTEFSPLTATASRENNNWTSPLMHVQ